MLDPSANRVTELLRFRAQRDLRRIEARVSELERQSADLKRLNVTVGDLVAARGGEDQC